MKLHFFLSNMLGITLTLVPLFGFSQTGPGGVPQTNGSSELLVWLDAEKSNLNKWPKY
ncbi:MAG: hypothetical protein ACI85Q_002694 [Salibacteraceae bacterium]|jgi:hypothetical protein